LIRGHGAILNSRATGVLRLFSCLFFRYDGERDGMLCSQCTEYASNLRSDSPSAARYKGAWVKEVVTGWDNVKKKLIKHDKSELHLTAESIMQATKQTQAKGNVLNVATVGMNAAKLKQAMSNRKSIIMLICVVFHLCVKKQAIYADNVESTLELLTENGEDG